ncbi:LysR family transcriptional regulator [Ramlibacter sp. AW1]|uniref:LysR family transcriptional regulator n=1 Tax=Ramlibacter aurantiacus TaxID=2801330 RepID=A0A937D727_9BURK|nr:LysR family transcriptional regulator [Ramlibacter aurantiacus]MBL0421568.1 LysR family transcriptional regulator [Ramlibacter aurantiacus]
MHSPLAFDWDDVRIFLAVARHGSTVSAARALGVNQSTVHRRMLAFEERIGRSLLVREPSGYRLTEFAQSLLPLAERMDEAAQALQHQMQADARSAGGVVRLTCPEPMVLRITRSGLLERFQQQHPGWRVEFVVSDRYLDLATGEVDVALRSGDTDAPDVIGSKIADSLWAVYASRSYVERHGQPRSIDDLRGHDLVGFDDSLAGHRASVWLLQVAPQGRIAARSNSVLGLLYAVKSGLGVAPLPTALGDAEPELVRVLGPVPELSRIWRVLAHKDRRHLPGVAAFFDFMVGQRDQLKAIFTG